MKTRSLPIKYSDCQKCKRNNILAYHFEGNNYSDIYKCLSCDALHIWNGISIDLFDKKSSVIVENTKYATLHDMHEYLFSRINFKRSFLDATALKAYAVLQIELKKQKKLHSLNVKI